MNFAERIIDFNANLSLPIVLPDGIRVMNPYVENEYAFPVSSSFYKRFYSDNEPRRIILGINPGRLGAGVTGIPFTDTKRLESHLDIILNDVSTHEPSSVFVYDVITAYGGPSKFYSDYYINSVCPLGFVKINEAGREVNYNYYDSNDLYKAVKPFIVESIFKNINLGCLNDVSYCLGNGKNYAFLEKLNQEYHFFDKIVPLEHPRFIMQYKLKRKEEYIEKFIQLLSNP